MFLGPPQGMEIVQTMNSDPGLAVGEEGRGAAGLWGRGHRAGPVSLVLGRVERRGETEK